LQSFAPLDLTLETERSSTNYIPGEAETYHAVSTNFWGVLLIQIVKVSVGTSGISSYLIRA